MARGRENTHFDGLDLIRMVAALAVLLYHFANFRSPTSPGTLAQSMGYPQLDVIGGAGLIGVEVFFVISGFVIAMSASAASPFEFLQKRALRILPTVWICGIVALAARAVAGEDLTMLFMSYLRSAVLSPKGPYIDGVVWTLVVEAVFYGFIFLCMLPGSAPPLRRIAYFLGLASAAYLAIFATTALLRHDLSMADSLYTLLARFPFKVLLLRYGVFFAIGILLYLRFVERDQPAATLPFAGFLAAFALLEIAITVDAESGGIAAAIAFWLVSLAAIVASIVYRSPIAERLSGGRRIVRKLGLLSYPLYLSHHAFGMVLVQSFLAAGMGATPTFMLSLGIVFATSWAVLEGPEPVVRGILRHAMALVSAAMPGKRPRLAAKITGP